MAAHKDREAVVAWALAALKGGAQAKALRQKLDRRPAPLPRFALDALERRILELAWAVERSLVAAEVARNKGGLTVERLRAMLGDEVDAALSPRRALRRHALVTVGAGGLPAASDLVWLAPALAARLDGVAEPEGLWLGTVRVAPGARGDVPARVALLLADLAAATPTLLTLDGCPRREAHELALGLARHLGRGVLLVDGELLADAPDAALLLACARREADCEGDALLVCAAAALGERWRALLAPAVGEVAPLVVLADGERTRDPVAAAPFAVRRLSLHAAPAPAPSAAATATEPRGEDRAQPVDDGLDHVRKQAIRDAERALGIFRAPPPPPPLRSPARPVGPPEPPRPAAPPVVESRPEPAPSPPLPQSPPPPLAAGKRRSAKGAQYFGGEEIEAPEPPRPAPPRAPVAAPPAPLTATSTAPPPAALLVSSEPDGVPLPVAADAAVDELARIACTSPSAAQRIDLIGRIRTVKSAVVVAALRANAGSAHAGVRAIAEQAMAALFGPNWNVSRPVPKPVQPPPSDDKDRGPPGGF